jgi:hypothetical protein
MRNKVDPEPPSTVNPTLPPALDRVVLQALAKLPQDRFASAKDFASAFAAAIKHSTKQPEEMQKPTFSYKPADAARQVGQQYSSPQTQQPPPQQRPLEVRQQHIPPQQLPPQAYQLATTYQLGTPLEEFRVDDYSTVVASAVSMVIIVLILVVIFVSSAQQQAESEAALRAAMGGIGTVGEVDPMLPILFMLPAWLIMLMSPIWLLISLRSWRVYLCSDGFIHIHDKKIDVFPWHQIKQAKKHKSKYTVIRRDSKKVVLSPCFQSIEYLGDYIIREYERVNKLS